MKWKPSEIVGMALGAAAAIPFAVWGFVLGGMFIGAATGGWLALPGALIGGGFVICAGALLGWASSRLIIAILGNIRQRNKS